LKHETAITTHSNSHQLHQAREANTSQANQEGKEMNWQTLFIIGIALNFLALFKGEEAPKSTMLGVSLILESIALSIIVQQLINHVSTKA
jgi:hypothetical protein